MKLWQIICLIGLLLIIVFNPKIQLTRIFVEQFKVYKMIRHTKFLCLIFYRF